MKKFLILPVFVLLFSCTSSDSDSNFFLTSVENVTPVITSGATTSSKNIKTSSITGTTLGAIYEVLREYQYPRDEGVVDMHNIYKVIYTAGQIYATALTSCTAITEAAVSSPFNLGVTDTYTCAGNSGTMSSDYANGFAIKDSATKYALLTFRWAGTEHGVLQGTHNATTGDLNLNLVELVDHDESHFAIRSAIEGNDTTHAFTVRTISSSITEPYTYTSVVGKGVSKGTGNYFLFKVKTNTLNGNYYCFPADATDTILDTMNTDYPDGKATVDAECAAYQTDVDALTFFTTSDIPTALSSFTNSSILLSY